MKFSPSPNVAGSTAPWRGFALATGAIVLGLGLVVLIGWGFGLQVLKSLHPAWVSMKPNAALALVFGGLSLCVAAGREPLSPGSRRLAAVLAAGVVLIGATTLVEYLGGWRLGIDEMLFREDAQAAATVHPGRMAPLTAIDFALIGAALCGASARRRVLQVCTQSLALLTALIASLSLVGYLFGDASLGSLAGYTPMAAHTSIAFVLLSAGTLALRPDAGWMQLVTGLGTGHTERPAIDRLPATTSLVHRFSARRVVNILFVGGAAVVGMVALLALVSSQRLAHDSRLRIRSYEVLDGFGDVRDALLDVETGARGFALTGTAEYLQPYDRGRRAFDAGLAAMRDLTADNPAQRQRTTAVEALARQRVAIAAEVVDVRRAQGPDAAGTMGPMLGTGKRVMDEARTLLDRMAAEEERLLVLRDAAALHTQRLAGVLTVGALGLAFGLFLAAFALYHREQGRREAHEDALECLNAALLNTNRELEAFSYSVAHDLRAPVRHIAGFAELLRGSAASHLDERGARYLTLVTDSARQLGTLIDDLLTFSRVGRESISPVRVPLEALVTEIVQGLGHETTGRRIDWVIGDLPTVTADAAMMRQVLANLLDNAVKYTRRREPARIEVGAQRTGRDVVVFVRDNGVGFDMAYADKLFTVFQRLHSASEFEGTGIGLANVRRIIARHGGRTWAEGAVDQGATFYFSLHDSPPAA